MYWIGVLLATIGAGLILGALTFVSTLIGVVVNAMIVLMGALPIALGLGAGSLSRRPLGFAIVGGLLFSTLLTLFVVPVVYVLFDTALARFRTRAPAGHGELAPAEAE